MNFKTNKYTKYYFDIINNAKHRIMDDKYYTENHHIIPKWQELIGEGYSPVKEKGR